MTLMEGIMPYGDLEWLALTQEETIEPDLPICDPHHHFWDYRSIRIPYQRYLLHELIADISSGHNVKSTVFIETTAMYKLDGPVELRSVGEVEFDLYHFAMGGLRLEDGSHFIVEGDQTNAEE